jgi:hypothetical protein
MPNNSLYIKIKNAKRKRLLLGHKVLYESISRHSEETLYKLEHEGGYLFPRDIREALLELGSCSIDSLNIHASQDIYAFDENLGPLTGFVTFASDDSGNYFSFNPKSEAPNEIYYCSHDPLGYVKVSASFSEYLHAFVESEFNTFAVTNKFDLKRF